MNAYSEDLRKKIVQTLRRGTGKSETARLFEVSLSSVKRYTKMADEGRPLAPKKRPGSRLKTSQDARQLLEALAEFEGYARALRRDYEAVAAALKYEWSNGQVEGQISRLKFIKRQMYGRASFDVLRQRVLGAA